MFRSTPCALLALAALAGAQSSITPTQPSSTGSATTSATGTVHTIIVGRHTNSTSGLVFTPNDLTATAGDQVEFLFPGGHHTVTQGTFDNPCQPANTSPFNSGLVPNGTFTITLNSTDPVYFYCATTGHCQAGMAGAINAPSSQSAEEYTSASKNTTSSSAPPDVQGGLLVQDAVSASPSSSASAFASSSTSTGSATRLLSSVSCGLIGAVAFAVIGSSV